MDSDMDFDRLLNIEGRRNMGVLLLFVRRFRSPLSITVLLRWRLGCPLFLSTTRLENTHVMRCLIWSAATMCGWQRT